MIEIRLLRYFVVVAEKLHFARAAEELHLAPQPLSQAIRRLEDQLGVQLFLRTSRKVELTPAGQVFYTRTRSLLTQLEETIQLTQRVSRGGAGSMRVGYVPGATASILPQLIQICNAQYPDLRLHLKEMTALEQLNALENQQLDAGIIVGLTFPGPIQHLLLKQEPLVAVLPAGHPLAGQSLTPEMLQKESIIGYDPLHCPELVTFIDEVAPAGHRQKELRQVVMSEASALSLADAGLGIAIVTESQGKRASTARVSPILHTHTSYHLVWQDNGNPTVQGMLSLREHLHLPLH
ncbi:LysR family transcriptional regulator [Deinococcus roseus]|uniref:Transcriptional regulator n=1 Tax=Deinococcus roseus TaxID=392414 RepID=A0ABQ2D546_9DEIO|nr:LysR substrate-binding domain-containing protein [Deinococcus roseus]GGJ43617.1 transcriptional regulator [Deinococcus roseus]